MKILCIGHAAYDITTPFKGYPVENTKNRVETRIECGGGPAANAAYLLGKWRADVAFAGIVGADEFGKRIQTGMEYIGVDTSLLQVTSDYQTTSSFIIANTENGTRTVLTYRPVTMKMKPVESFEVPDIILIDGQEIEFSKQVLQSNPNLISIIDAGRPTEEIIALAKMVTYVVCSKEFAEKVTGITMDYDNLNTISTLYKQMKETFPGIVVITLEAKGCLYELDGKLKIMPSYDVKAVDSTGAGDIFHGAFAYGIAKGWEFEKILQTSNLAGALSVTKLGSSLSIPSKEEMKAVFHEFE